MTAEKTLHQALSIVLIVLAGVFYYAIAEFVDRDVIPVLIDQGSYVFNAADPSVAMGRWNFLSHVSAILASGLFAGMALQVISRSGNWLESVPAAITAAGFFIVDLSRETYRPYPLVYDVIETATFLAALPLWFVFINWLRLRLGGGADA